MGLQFFYQCLVAFLDDCHRCIGLNMKNAIEIAPFDHNRLEFESSNGEVIGIAVEIVEIGGSWINKLD